MEFNLPLFVFGVFISGLVMLGVGLALAALRTAHTSEAAETTDRARPASGASQA